MLCAHILTVEVLYTETSVTTFMIFSIFLRILWKNSIDFHVFILFIIPILGICNLFLPDHGQYVGLKHAVLDKNEHIEFVFCVCEDHITSQTYGLYTEGLPYFAFFGTVQ